MITATMVVVEVGAVTVITTTPLTTTVVVQ